MLCVDDERLVLQGLERTLYEHFDVTVFESPIEALQLLSGEHEPFSVIVSDMRMPTMNGAAFLAKAREIVPQSTRILLTGQTDMDAAVSAINQGSIFRFLTKPCPPDVLIGAIQAAAEQHRLLKMERELLEQTLTGSIRLLSEVLSLVAPAVFERSQRIKGYVLHMAKQLHQEELWHFELAASLSMLGCVGLPEQTLGRLLSGRSLEPDEQRIFNEHPKTAHRLLSKIPRFGEVAEMIRLQLETKLPGDLAEPVRVGAILLRIAREVDHLVETGATLRTAVTTLENKAPASEKALIATLEDFQASESSTAIKQVRINQMTAHMILEEDVRTTAGVVVLPKGREITSVLLERLWNFSAQGSLVEPVLVRVPN